MKREAGRVPGFVEASMSVATSATVPAAGLVSIVTCPHCSHRFRPEELRFIARSSTLNYDHRLRDGAMRRFLPSVFSFEGDAIDAGGEVCSETACPRCHLKVPRLLVLRPTVPLSIFGSPSSGKSYLLGAMSRTLRETLGGFGLRYDDVDTEANEILLDYERRLFQQPSNEHWVYLEKTQEIGNWYSDVWLGPRLDRKSGAELARNRKTFPKPFLLRVDPTVVHPAVRDGDALARVICLYDNAGEHFQVGGDRYNTVTGHLKDSEGMIFVFDPTQDQKFRAACRERSNDRQFKDIKVDTQDVLYGNVMNRILALRGMQPTARLKIPLVVALTKFDAWRFLLGPEPLPPYWRDVSHPSQPAKRIRAYDPWIIQQISAACRRLLEKVAPHVLATIESRCDGTVITYVPVSATGGPSVGKTSAGHWPFAPEPAPPEGYDYFLQKDIRPMWAEVPLLALIARCAPYLVPTIQR
jgi:hypothetical protein